MDSSSGQPMPLFAGSRLGPYRDPRRGRGMGGGLPRARPAARPRGGDQGPARPLVNFTTPTGSGASTARAGRRGAQSSQHPHDPRRGHAARGCRSVRRGHALRGHEDCSRVRRFPSGCARAPCRGVKRSRRRCRSLRPGRRAREGNRAPRPQAGQRLLDPRWAREDHGLRPRPS